MGSNPSKVQQPDYGDNMAAGSDEYRTSVKHKQYEFVCTPCARNYKHVSASIYCKSCQDHLCFRCLQWHTKYKYDHVNELIGQDAMRKLGFLESLVMPTEKCVDHDGKTWNMFCQKDGIAGCQICMEETHGTCYGVIPRSSLQIEAANRQLKKINRTDDFKLAPNDGQVGGKLRQKVADNDQVDGRKRQAAYHSEYFQVAGDLKNVAQRQYDDQVDGSKKINKRPNTSSTDDGQVPGTSRSDAEKTICHEDDGQVSGTKNQHSGLYSVGSSRDVDVRLENDSDTCCICDISVLSDGRILMSDWDNNKLKLLDSNLNIIHHSDVRNSYGICMINDTEAAVSMPGCQIQFVYIEDKLKLGRRIKLDHYCCGVAYSNGELYVSDTLTNIHVYTVEGVKLRTFKTGLSGEQLGGLEWLAVSKDRCRIYMTSLYYGIVCLDSLSGEVIWKVKDTDNNRYSGVCVERFKNVFVCRHWKHDVVQFSPSGQLTGVVINESEGLEYPQSTCIDETRNRLIVGMGGNDFIKVFEMKL